jgi:hypothetical protein
MKYGGHPELERGRGPHDVHGAVLKQPSWKPD